MSTQTITEFLEARIAEDEAAANRCDAAFIVPDAVAGSMLDPARVLAECAAKRVIIGLFRTATLDLRGQIALRALAAVYADHADYQQEWAL